MGVLNQDVFYEKIPIESWCSCSRSETWLYIKVQFPCEPKFYKGTL